MSGTIENRPADGRTGAVCPAYRHLSHAGRCVGLVFSAGVLARAVPVDAWWARASALRWPAGRPTASPRPMGTESRYA